MQRLALLLSASLLLSSCSSVYYGAMEKIGVPKRSILVERVQAARGAQQEAKQQFANALQQFLAVTKVPATELQATHGRLHDELKRSESRAQEVRDRIEAIDSVAAALFAEWSAELAHYSNPNLRAQSARQLDATRRRYTDLMRVMNTAADRMEPVLTAFRDQVLFLKHNLNAQAVAALDGTTRDLQQDIGLLIADMEKSIREADTFLASMQTVR